MFKKTMAAVLAGAVCCATLFSGCGQASTTGTANKSAGSSSEPTKLVYYTIGTAGSDLPKVMAEVNKITKAKINCTVEMNYIDYGDYDQKMSAIINSGENYDLCFTTADDLYLQNVKKNAFAPLDDLLKTDGQGILDQMDSRFWTGVKVNDKIYAVPTDKEIAAPYYYVYNKELVEKYKMDISKIDSLDQLEPLFKTIKEKEPSWTPYLCWQNLLMPVGYAFPISQGIPAVIDEHSQSGKILNLYDEQKTVDTIKTMRKYFLAGYINKDAATAQQTGDPKSFFTMNLAGPDADSAFSVGSAYPKVSHLVETPPMITTYSAQGAMVAISSGSKNKDAAMKFVNLCHTDKDLIDLLYHGIKGVHWNLDANGQVKVTPESKNYMPQTYTLGSNVIATPVSGSPKTWEADYRAFNKSAQASVILGFQPDISSISSEIASVTNVVQKYQGQLYCGCVDPDVYLPKMRAELKSAGIDKIISTLQTQLDAFRAKSK
jgi:putative aldouronate transport system substrate-binding protein